MTKCIAVFRSKTDLFTFINYMKYGGAFIGTTATPKEARIGCGLSAKFDERFYRLALNVLSSYDFPSFFGIYKIKNVNGRISTVLVTSF